MTNDNLHNEASERNFDSYSFVDGEVPVLYDPSCTYSTAYPTDTDLSKKLVWSYSGSAMQGVSWVKDLSMMKYARAVMCYYNRGVPGRNNGSKWADRADLFFFDAAVKYFQKYNYAFQYTQMDCSMLKSMLTAIDAERTNVTQLRVTGSLGTGEEGTYLGILKDLESVANNNISSLNCDVYLDQQQQQNISDQSINNFQKVNDLTKTTDNTLKYVILGMIGLVVVIALTILLKPKHTK